MIMDLSFLKPMGARVKPGGMMLLDSSVISTKVERDDLTVHYLPVTQKALDMGNVQVTNLILLGAYVKTTGAVPIEAIEQALEERMLGTRREALLPLNKEALKEGAKLALSQRASQKRRVTNG